MPNVLELKQKAAELNNEVKAKMKACETGEITVADFSQYMENASKQDKEIADGIKAYNAAKAFSGSGGADQDPNNGAPGAGVTPSMVQKRYNDNMAAYKRLQSCAAANLANKGEGRGSFSFDIGLKHPGEPGYEDAGVTHMKAQGVSGLQGAWAQGTTAPPTGTLADGQLFPTGTAGPAIEPQFLPGIAEMRFYPNVIASLFPSFPVSSPIVSYVKEDVWNNNAAATAEGATKPTSTHGLSRYTETIGKIANLERVTDELIQDAAYFWALIQRRGVQGVTRAEEVEMLAGVGMPGINGLLRRSAYVADSTYPTGFTRPQNVPAVTNLQIGGAVGSGATPKTVASVKPGRLIEAFDSATAGVTLAEGILQAITDIRLNWFYEPDAAVLNPLDWQVIRLAKDANGQYLGGSFFGTNYGVAANAGPVSSSVGVEQGLTLWNKRIVSTPVEPQGLPLVGDFADGGQVLRLGGLRVDITNTNGFDFEQNLWTMRIEERAGLLIDKPELFELVQVQYVDPTP